MSNQSIESLEAEKQKALELVREIDQKIEAALENTVRFDIGRDRHVGLTARLGFDRDFLTMTNLPLKDYISTSLDKEHSLLLRDCLLRKYPITQSIIQVGEEVKAEDCKPLSFYFFTYLYDTIS